MQENKKPNQVFVHFQWIRRRNFVSERDMNGDNEAQTHDRIFTKEVACDIKVEHKSFWLDILKKFSKATDSKAT
jgi:hypothetical protein